MGARFTTSYCQRVLSSRIVQMKRSEGAEGASDGQIVSKTPVVYQTCGLLPFAKTRSIRLKRVADGKQELLFYCILKTGRWTGRLDGMALKMFPGKFS